MSKTVHTWEPVEITLEASGSYRNPYTDVEVWVQLDGPGFSRRVWGFWDGGTTFRVRVVATEAGRWQWRSGANVVDPGLVDIEGQFTAVAWGDDEKRANSNRRGFIRQSTNGHGLVYADGTPFFLVGDTWWAAGTWRYPFKGTVPAADYEPGSGIGFEEAVQFRKRQGFNSISLIAAFPNWHADGHPPTLRDTRPYSEYGGTPIRHAWEKNGTGTAKDMHDEDGNRPFLFPGKSESYTDVCADYDRLEPAYFRNLDRKIRYLSDNGFVPFFETVRRDHGPTWKACYDWETSFPRYVNYLAARYGCWNLVFSGAHVDWIHQDFSLQPDDWSHILNVWYERYGPLPFGQPTTILTPCASDHDFGHGMSVPWLRMHGVGNAIRSHDMHQYVERIYRLKSPVPCINQEPYYPGWEGCAEHGSLERSTSRGSELENYYARAMMYGSVLSGALAGHVYGTGAYGGDTTGEPEGQYPHIWEALRYESGAQMGHLHAFMLSEVERYQELTPSNHLVDPNRSPAGRQDNLDGWAYAASTHDKSLIMGYFERYCRPARLVGIPAGGRYLFTWFDPRNGLWHKEIEMHIDDSGMLALPSFPDGGGETNERDWAWKMVAVA